MKLQVEETENGQLLWTSPDEPGRMNIQQTQDFTLQVTMESGQKFTAAGAGYFEETARRNARYYALEHQLRKSWWGRRLLHRVKHSEEA